MTTPIDTGHCPVCGAALECVASYPNDLDAPALALSLCLTCGWENVWEQVAVRDAAPIGTPDEVEP